MTSKYFSDKEVVCKCGECGKLPLPRTMAVADKIREGWGSPIAISSGARCEDYTYYLILHGIPAAKRSAHIDGMALDMRPTNGKIREFQEYVKSRLAELDIRMEDPVYTKSWVHFDLRRVPRGMSRIFKP